MGGITKSGFEKPWLRDDKEVESGSRCRKQVEEFVDAAVGASAAAWLRTVLTRKSSSWSRRQQARSVTC